MASLNALNWTPLADDAVEIGDVVSADAGGMPIYRVVAMQEGRVWLQEDRAPEPQLMPLGRFRWKAANRL